MRSTTKRSGVSAILKEFSLDLKQQKEELKQQLIATTYDFSKKVAPVFTFTKTEWAGIGIPDENEIRRAADHLINHTIDSFTPSQNVEFFLIRSGCIHVELFYSCGVLTGHLCMEVGEFEREV